MKRKITIVTLIAALVGGSLVYFLFDVDKQMKNPISWEAYSPENQRFQVQFPSQPEESSMPLDVEGKTLDYQEYKTSLNNTSYLVSFVDFPGIWKLIGTSSLLKKTFNGIVENEEGIEKVLHQELSQHNGYPALAYTVMQGGKEVQGKLIIAGNTLYRIAVSYPVAAAEKIDPQSFFESFQANT